MEGPVVLAGQVDSRGVHACLQRLALEIRVLRVGGRDHGRGRVGGQGKVTDRGVDVLLLEDRGVLRHKAVEVRVFDEPLELVLAGELVVYANVHCLAVRLVFKLHAALEVDLREHLRLILLALAIVLRAVVLDFALFNQDRTGVLEDAGLLDLEVVARHDPVREHLGRGLVAVEGFIADLDGVDRVQFHLDRLNLDDDCDEVRLLALSSKVQRKDLVLPESDHQVVLVALGADVSLELSYSVFLPAGNDAS